MPPHKCACVRVCPPPLSLSIYIIMAQEGRFVHKSAAAPTSSPTLARPGFRPTPTASRLQQVTMDGGRPLRPGRQLSHYSSRPPMAAPAPAGPIIIKHIQNNIGSGSGHSIPLAVPGSRAAGGDGVVVVVGSESLTLAVPGSRAADGFRLVFPS